VNRAARAPRSGCAAPPPSSMELPSRRRPVRSRLVELVRFNSLLRQDTADPSWLMAAAPPPYTGSIEPPPSYEEVVLAPPHGAVRAGAARECSLCLSAPRTVRLAPCGLSAQRPMRPLLAPHTSTL
jgi:hypothetical protein